jgi:uncharacterized membrane protein
MSDTENTQPEEPQVEETQPEEAQPEEAQPEEIAGVGLMIAAFHTEDAGDQALKAMKQAKKNGQFYYEAAAVIKKEADGDVHYHETGDMSTGKGAGIGALIGGVIGLLGGPVGIALGAGAGAAIGGIAAHGDAGFRDSSLDQIGSALRPGSSAVMVITSKAFLKDFRKQVSDADIYPMMQAIGSTITDAQLQGQDMVLGIVLTEEGVAVKRLAVDETTAEVFGFVATDEGVAVGGAYADETGVIYQVGVSDAEGVATQTGVITDEGAVIVNESTPAGSDETTVDILAAVPEEAAGELPEAAAEETTEEVEASEEKPAAEEGEA